MKAFFSILGIISVCTVIWFIVWSFQMSQSFGWKPPSTAFELTQKEKKWKKQVESNYNCKLIFIGLDDNFVEDSIVYITLNYEDKSILKNCLNEDLELCTKKIASSFVNSAENRRKQSHILITYSLSRNTNKDVVENNIPKVKKCLYDIKNKTCRE